MSEYYVLDGHNVRPVGDVTEWATRFEADNRHVADDRIGEVRVSTVFLGLDHSFGEGPPLLFETMIFGGRLDQEQRRYATWDDAEKGHAKMLAAVKEEANVEAD